MFCTEFETDGTIEGSERIAELEKRVDGKGDNVMAFEGDSFVVEESIIKQEATEPSMVLPPLVLALLSAF